jgi:predicted phage terminase large subunit-like protein
MGLAEYASRGRWTRARHLKLLNRKLIDLAYGSTRRLIVTMPPRHGKSMLISQYFPAWYIGMFPDRRVMLASYEAGFAATWGRKARDVLEELGPSLFNIKIRDDSSAADRWDIRGRTGGMVTAGVGGPLTGKGADILLIDDPVKNAEDAASKTMRDKAWEWYQSTAYTRLEPNGAAILIMTRWNEDDLAGRILKDMQGGGEHWEVLDLPAIADENDQLGRKVGEALWPERFTIERLLEIKKTLGTYYFSALYQQRPQPQGQTRFRREWFRYATKENGVYTLQTTTGPKRWDESLCWKFQTCDPSASESETADFFALSTWAVTPDKELVLLGCVHIRADTTKHDDVLAQARMRWNPTFQGVENKTFGLNIIQALVKLGYAIKALKADIDKVSRSIPISTRYENGMVYHMKDADCLDEYELELLAFPNGAHDDLVDTASYAGIEITGSAEPNVRWL